MVHHRGRLIAHTLEPTLLEMLLQTTEFKHGQYLLQVHTKLKLLVLKVVVITNSVAVLKSGEILP